MVDDQTNITVSSSRTDYGSTTNRTSLISNKFVNSSITNKSLDNVHSSLSRDYQYFRNPYPTATSNPRFRPRRTKMTVDRMPNSETHQIIERIEYFFNVINHICIGFVTIYMSWLCLRLGLVKTALHAWLVTIGFSLLMAEAIMCHYNGNVLTFYYHRPTKTAIHWILQVLGGGCGITGILVKSIQKGFLIQTTHGKLGFSAFILCAISMISGLLALFAPRVKLYLSPLLNKTFHNVLGIITFVIALLAQYYGYETKFFMTRTETDFQTLIKTVTIISLVLTIIGPLKAMYHKLCNIIRHFS